MKLDVMTTEARTKGHVSIWHLKSNSQVVAISPSQKTIRTVSVYELPNSLLRILAFVATMLF